MKKLIKDIITTIGLIINALVLEISLMYDRCKSK